MNNHTEFEPTHSVFNQSPNLHEYSLWQVDPVLQEVVAREGAQWDFDTLATIGATAGANQAITWGFQANENPPKLQTHDRLGHRIDSVDFHPAWHHLMALSTQHQCHNLSWADPKPGVFVARAARYFLLSQNEASHGCPITMTFAAIPVLQQNPHIYECLQSLLTSKQYDPSFKPMSEKQGVLLGMAMTEKQGGTDVRANTTKAVSVNQGEYYVLTGHKWFCSAPMCDAFLTLAQTELGLSCFLLPRWRKDGSLNNIHLQRLKEKLGNLANASSEIELHQAEAYLLGEEGRGINTIIQMVNFTRFDCALGSAALIRQSLTQAMHHAKHRQAFGKTLNQHPMMQAVLADLCIESEAAISLVMHLGHCYDEGTSSFQQKALARIGTALAKYWICKRTPSAVNEAMECLGGNGYVEESILPRLYREAPLNSIWEGCGNVNCLDVMRALVKEPETLEAYQRVVTVVKGVYPSLDGLLTKIESLLNTPKDLEYHGRYLVESMAKALQASILIQSAPSFVADAFCKTRIQQAGGLVYGAVPDNGAVKEILERNFF